MRVLFFNPSFPVYLKMPAIPLGLLSIASYIEAIGHTVKIIDRAVEKKTDIRRILKVFRPDIVGISVISLMGATDADRITKEVHDFRKIPVVWGGHAPGAHAEMIFNEMEPDLIIYGEGELTWAELLNKISLGEDYTKIDGLIYKKNNSIVKTRFRELADLHQFPEINWNLIQIEKYYSAFLLCKRMQYLHASKGCFGQCTFCSNKDYHHSANRSRNIPSVIRDVQYLYEHKADGIYFSDELFLPKRQERTEFCQIMIEKNFDLVWGCMMRVGVLNEDDVKLMYQAGCRWILFGIESGCNSRLEKIKKNIDLDLARKTVKWCRNAGITVIASFIIGYPDETTEELKQTVGFINSIDANLLQVQLYMPLAKSELYDEMVQNKKYNPPTTVHATSKKVYQNIGEVVAGDFADVPANDLRVIHYYYQWKAFADKRSVEGQSFGLVKKMARDTMERIFTTGFVGFFYGTFKSALQFCTVFYYSHMFPKTKKQYGLEELRFHNEVN